MDTGTPDAIKMFQSGYKLPNFLGMTASQPTPQEIERMVAEQSPAFGVFPQMKPYRSQQDITASANVPVDLLRGRVAGTRGLFGDVVNQPIPMVRPLQLFSQAFTGQQKYPDTEHYLETMPLKSNTPVGDVAGRIGSFAPINPMPAVRAGQKGLNLLGMEVADRLATGRSVLPSLLKEPQSAMFAVEPNPSMADESSAMRQQLTDKMQALLAQKKVATSAVDVGAINQQIGELQAQFKSLPAMGRVAKEVVVPEITAPVSNLGFYSATEQAAINLERSKGTGQSFLNDLMNAPDVKNYEIEAMGLDTYLKGKPNVTRQEVQDFIANNKLDVQEVQLGENITEDPIGIAKRKEIFDKYDPQIQALDNEKVQYATDIVNARNLAKKNYAEANAALNRENLFGSQPIPTTEDWNRYYLANAELERMNKIPLDTREFERKINALRDARDAEANAAYVVPESTPTKYDKYQLPGGENYRELLLTLPQKETRTPNMIEYEKLGQQMFGGALNPTERARLNELENLLSREERSMALSGGKSKTSVYQSSHFEEPNILAHMRVNDRVDAEGKKMLLIEEVQSDWHQAGREKGYKGKGTLTELPDNYFVQELKTIDGDTMYVVRDNSNPSVIINKDYNRQSAINGVINELNATSAGGVPDAPFKDTWHQLALKRAIKEAVDKGYDRIGLTTGAQQAERYDLSKQIDLIDYRRSSNNTFELGVVGKNGETVDLPKRFYTAEELPSVLGKEVAEKIVKGEGEKGGGRMTLRGLDLQVGGEGMKKYYDEIYPNYLNKLGKKYGAQVGETKVNTGIDNLPAGSSVPTMKQEPVRYLDITPEMRKAIKEGQPLASIEEELAKALA
jgi:hypothetical protein